MQAHASSPKRTIGQTPRRISDQSLALCHRIWRLEVDQLQQLVADTQPWNRPWTLADVMKFLTEKCNKHNGERELSGHSLFWHPPPSSLHKLTLFSQITTHHWGEGGGGRFMKRSFFSRYSTHPKHHNAHIIDQVERRKCEGQQTPFKAIKNTKPIHVQLSIIYCHKSNIQLWNTTIM